jgi:hypothetical protein
MNSSAVFSLRKVLGIFIILLVYFTFGTKQSLAASLASASATLTTSRPSPSSPGDDTLPGAATTATQVTILNNSSRFLASDSAKIIRSQGTVITTNNLIIASQSGALTTVYLSSALSATFGKGADVIFVPITATHTFAFQVQTGIPVSGTIVLTYPGAANNTASPSATTFAFNNLIAGNVKAAFSAGSAACTFVISAPTITCTITTGAVSAGTTIYISVGCSAISAAGSCTTQVPTLINPTKSSATAGSADIWKVGVQTTDAGFINLDTSTIALGTIESVTIRATVDPSLTFDITGVNNATLLSGIYTGCSQADTTNTGINSTATEVPLGSLSNPPGTDVVIRNLSAQKLVVTTNGTNGYSITATSSGALKNQANGYSINSSVAPITFSTANHFFGFHACGLDTDLTKWASTGSSACNTYITGSTAPICKYAWPTQTSAVLIAQRGTGPVGNAVVAGSGQNIVSYAATQDVTLPPGQYTAVVTYVATPSF